MGSKQVKCIKYQVLKTKYYYSALIVLLLFTGCSSSRYYYDPALFNSGVGYQPKPISFDSVKSSNYISVGSGSITKTEYESTLFQFDYNKGYTFKNINLSYGAFGLAGSVKNTRVPAENAFYYKRKSFAALGAKTVINTFFTSGRTDFRIVGLELAYSKEFGKYADYRRMVLVDPDFYSIINTGLFTGGLSSEVIWHHKKTVNTQFGIRLYIGRTFGNYYYINSQENYNMNDLYQINASLNFFFQLKRFNAVLENGTASYLKVGYRF